MSTASSVPVRLSAALAGRYRIERGARRRQHGHRVLFATDLRHDRQVALKVLRAELALALGPSQARLDHPHILALHDSGDADGFLYYVMPFVGESLRDRNASATAPCR